MDRACPSRRRARSHVRAAFVGVSTGMRLLCEGAGEGLAYDLAATSVPRKSLRRGRGWLGAYINVSLRQRGLNS